jgi:hypothetical protein
MDLSKIKQLHIWIIGTVLIIIAEVLILFMMYKPQGLKYDAAKIKYDGAIDLGNEEALAAADKSLADAKKSVRVALNDLDGVMKRRMPVLDFTKRDVGMIAMWYEQITKMGPILESFANDPNVRVSPVSFSLPAPPSSPNDSLFDSNVLTFPLGNITAQGDFKSLMNHVRRWSNCKRLVLVDGVSLTGNSPNLSVSYSIQCFVYPTATGGKTDPMWGASTGGGGGMQGPGGGTGGPGGGMPGMGMGMGMGPGAKGMPGAGGPAPGMPGMGMGAGPGAKGMPGMMGGPGAKAGSM